MGVILTINDCLEEIRHNIRFGFLEKAEEIIDDFNNCSSLRDRIKFEILLFKSLIYYKKGKMWTSYNIINDLLKSEIVKNKSLNSLRVLSLKIIVEIWMGKLEKVKTTKRLTEQLFADLMKNNFEIKVDYLIAYNYSISVYNYHTNNNEGVIQFSNKIIELASKIDDKYHIGLAYEIMGLSYQRLGKSDLAFDFINKAISLFQETNNEFQLMIEYHHLGMIFAGLGQREKAIELMKKTLPLCEKLNDDSRFSVNYYHLGVVNYNMCEFDEAKKYLQLALEKQEKIRNPNVLIRALILLIDIAENLNNFEDLKKYYTELVKLKKSVKHDPFLLRIKIAEAIIQKNCLDIIERQKAESFLRGVIDSYPNNQQIQYMTRINLAEILLKNYLSTGNQAILEELFFLTDELVNLIDSNKIPKYKLEVYNLRLLTLWGKSQIEGDNEYLSEIYNLLTSAQEIAGKKGFKLLAEQFSARYERLVNHLFISKNILHNYYDYLDELSVE